MTDFRGAGHLPNVRGDRGGDPAGLPRQRRGTTPQMHGRYPDFDVLAEEEHWDEPTRRVVTARVEHVPRRAFFTESEFATLAAFADVVLHQPDDPRIPALSFVDEKLAAGRGEGYRYDDMPGDGEVWRLVAKALDESAGGSFADADPDERLAIVGQLAEGRSSGGTWERLNVERAWAIVVRDLAASFYAHPWAWNEIGFGGPAYPRGYARLGVGLSESWEGTEAFELDPVGDVQERGLE
jgi:hypothetical protein